MTTDMCEKSTTQHAVLYLYFYACRHATAVLIIIEGHFQIFQRFSSSKLVLKTVKSCFAALNCYENGSSGEAVPILRVIVTKIILSPRLTVVLLSRLQRAMIFPLGRRLGWS
jgi:hypothetical protein